MGTKAAIAIRMAIVGFTIILMGVSGSHAAIDTYPEMVIGQPDFTSNTCDNGGLGPGSLCFPYAAALDALGNIYISDTTPRVQEFDDPIRTDRVADRVFGQPDFITQGCNSTGRSASSVCAVYGVAVDPFGDLYASDAGLSYTQPDVKNNRLLVYADPLGTDSVADMLFGASDFTAPAGCSTAAFSLCIPDGVTFDASGNLYLVDRNKHRVLEFDNPAASDLIPDRVFGQPDFNGFRPNNGGVHGGSLNTPYGVATDREGNLYVADAYNSRVLVYLDPLNTDTIADRVIGQKDLLTGFMTGADRSLTAATLSFPTGVAVDSLGNVYIVDSGGSGVPGSGSGFPRHSRVLVYRTFISSDAVADAVFGQPDFMTGACNTGGLSATSLCDPHSVTVDNEDNLYIVDRRNSRVLMYEAPIPDATASDLLAEMIAAVDSIPGLPGGLRAKLREAQQDLEAGREIAAANKLRDFIDQVEAMRGKSLTDQEAVMLIGMAQETLDLMVT